MLLRHTRSAVARVIKSAPVDYWAPHMRLVLKLREIGVFHSMNDRLPLFQYRNEIDKFKVNADLKRLILSLIDECITLRREGHESKHVDGKYV